MVTIEYQIMNANADNMEMNDDVLISYLLGEADAQQLHQVAVWRASNPENERHFMEFKLIWARSLELDFKGKNSAAESLQRLKSRLAEQHEVRTTTKGIKLRTWLSIAAGITVLFTATWLYINEKYPAELQTKTVNIVQTDTLSDGSIVTLNKQSVFTYPEKFTGNQRLVALPAGEAFFNITPDKTKPFIIRSGMASIRVVGTSFNVKHKNNAVEVIVETGTVQVSSAGKTITLHSGDKGLVDNKTGISEKSVNTDQLYTWYRSKVFIAENTSLWRMVDVLNEAYSANISIGRKELRDLQLHTTFKNESLAEILKVISDTFNITVEKHGDQIILR